jgi:hypothetical protein
MLPPATGASRIDIEKREVVFPTGACRHYRSHSGVMLPLNPVKE